MNMPKWNIKNKCTENNVSCTSTWGNGGSYHGGGENPNALACCLTWPVLVSGDIRRLESPQKRNVDTEYSDDPSEDILRGITRGLLILNLGTRQVTLEGSTGVSTEVSTEELTLCYRSN